MLTICMRWDGKILHAYTLYSDFTLKLSLSLSSSVPVVMGVVRLVIYISIQEATLMFSHESW